MDNTDDGTRKATAEWFRILRDNPEEDLIKRLKHNKELESKPIKFYYDFCSCHKNFEQLYPDKGVVSTYLDQLHTTLLTGVCPHVILGIRQEELEANPLVTMESLNQLDQESTRTSFLELLRKVLKHSVRMASITVIHVAIAVGKEKVVKHLLKSILHREIHKSDPIYTGTNAFTLLHTAVVHGQSKILKHLVSKGSPGVNQREGMKRWPNLFRQTPYELAAARNDLKSLKTLFKIKEGSYSRRVNIQESFVASMKTRSIETMKFLIGHGAGILRFEHNQQLQTEKKACLRKIIINNDIEFLKEIIKSRNTDWEYLLNLSVYYDAFEFVQLILHSANRSILSKEYNSFPPCLIQATLNNSTKVLNLLINSPKLIDIDNSKLNNYTPLTWANVLGFKECEEMLKDYFEKSLPNDNPPLIRVFDCKITGYTNDRPKLVQLLLEKGWNVNIQNQKGHTPLSCALKANDFKSVRLLLMAGADPFLGWQNYEQFMANRWFVAELLYANADVYEKVDNHSTFVARPLPSSRRSLVHVMAIPKAYAQSSYSELTFVLQYLHTLSKHDLYILSNLHISPVVPKEIIAEINKFLSEPRSLTILCRNAIRKSQGIKIHDFVQCTSLPQSMRDFLTLESCLAERLKERHTYAHLCTLCRKKDS